MLDWCCLNATAGPHYTNLDGVDVSDGDCGDDCDIDGHDDCRGMAKVFSLFASACTMTFVTFVLHVSDRHLTRLGWRSPESLHPSGFQLQNDTLDPQRATLRQMHPTQGRLAGQQLADSEQPFSLPVGDESTCLSYCGGSSSVVQPVRRGATPSPPGLLLF